MGKQSQDDCLAVRLFKHAEFDNIEDPSDLLRFSIFSDGLPDTPSRNEEPELDQVPEEPQRIVYRATQCEPPEQVETEIYQVGKVRQLIDDAIWSYALEPNPDYMLLIKAPPGTGKTHAGTKLAHRYHEETGRRVGYMGPRHDFFMELIDESKKLGYDQEDWYEWLPRQMDEEEPARTTCIHSEKITSWIDKGYRSQDFCSQICGWDYYSKKCKYAKQMKITHPIIYGNHNHVTGGHPLAEKIGLLIGDEDPMTTFAAQWHVAAESLLTNMPYDEPMTEIIVRINQLVSLGIAAHGKELLQLIFPGDTKKAYRDIYTTCSEFDWSIVADKNKIAPPKLNKPEDVNSIPALYLSVLVPILQKESLAAYEDAVREENGEEAVGYPSRLYVAAEGLTMLYKRKVQERMPKHIIWFDATGQPELYKQMFDREVKVIDANIEIIGKINQVVNRNNNKTSFLDDSGEISKEKIEQLKKQIIQITKRYNNPGLITFLSIEELAVPTEHMETGHFYANRGSNRYGETDVLIVAGTPQVKRTDVEMYAKCLWPDRMEPFDTTYKATMRKYKYVDGNGNGWEYPTNEFEDKNLNKLLWHFREAEMIQAIHRARIAIRDVPTYLLSSIPIDDLPPTNLMTLNQLMRAPENVNAFKWQEVEEAASKMAREHGSVTVAMMVDEININRRTAKKYIELLLATGRWEKVEAIREKGKRGPIPLALHKINS